MAVFFFINKNLQHPLIDTSALLVRQAYTWIPLYLFFLLFFILNFRRHTSALIFLTLLTFAITDYTSASILKPWIGRLRPCHNPQINSIINNISGCGGVFSMPSSHASNHFGLATIWYLCIQQITGQKWWWLWIWAAAVGFSQIYVGVHYPADILAGTVLGLLSGWFTYYLFLEWQKRSAIYKRA